MEKPTMKQGDKPTMKQGDKPTMKQGDPLISKIPNEDENCGTLGGFVTKTDDARKIFALTCNHVFSIRKSSCVYRKRPRLQWVWELCVHNKGKEL